MYQTRRLCEAWSQEASRELHLDVNSLTLAVISLAAFGKPIDWTSASTENKDIPKGYKISFLEAIHGTANYIVAILLFPGWLLRLTPLRKAHVAQSQLDIYLREMIRSEKRKIEENSEHQSLAKGNLLTAVLRASASEAKESNKEANSNTRKQAFTKDEVMGNLFVYLLGGKLCPLDLVSEMQIVLFRFLIDIMKLVANGKFPFV